MICIAVTPKLKKKKVQRTSEHQRHWLWAAERSQVYLEEQGSQGSLWWMEIGYWCLRAHTHTHSPQPDKPLLLTETGINSLSSSFLLAKRLTLEQSNTWSYRFWYSVSYYFIPQAPLQKVCVFHENPFMDLMDFSFLFLWDLSSNPGWPFQERLTAEDSVSFAIKRIRNFSLETCQVTTNLKA